MTSHRIFESDPEFCPDCGSILPLPGLADLVVCQKCNFSVPVEAFFGIERVSTTVFNKPKSKQERKLDKDPGTAQPTGPKVERQCGKCGHDEMTYRTQQTRSADEGQTVFYTCTKCGHQEVENS